MRSLRSVVALALVAGAAPVAGPLASACAGEGARAALVVDTGAAVTTYCVALPDASVTGIELVELAGAQHGLDYSLGFGGEAVCRLEGVGPEGDDCFGEYPEFWGYWHGDGSGGWSWAGTGAGSASIGDGDVDGWSWGAGDNGSNHQAPPSVEHFDVCDPSPEAPAKAKAGPSRRKPVRTSPRDQARGPAEPAAAPATATQAPERARPGRARRPGLDDLRRNRRPGKAIGLTERPSSPEPSAFAAAPANDEEPAGPPVTGLVGLLAAAGLGAAVWSGARRRSRP